jgi:signal transduction histidine kinase
MTLKHEINNPLAIILGYTRLLKKQIPDRETLKKIDEIEVASQRINHALKEFSAAQIYEVAESPVGNLVELTPYNAEKKQ